MLSFSIFLCRQSIVPAESGPEAVCRTYNEETDLPVASPFLVLALPIFPCRQSIVPAELGPELHIIICKKTACRWQAVFLCWRYLSSRAVTRKVLSAKVSLTSVFGMGTGGPSPQSTPTSSTQSPLCSVSAARLRARRKFRPLPCVSSQNHKRFAGL